MATTWKPEATATRRGHLRLVRDDVSALLAHDLKTPLAAIAMNVDFVLGELGPDANASVRGALEDCRESNQDAVGIVLDMVDAMQLSSGQRRAYIVPVDAQACVAAGVRRAAAAGASRGVRLALSAEPTSMCGDADLLDRALDRLLDRAMRHARPGGSIDVTLKQRTIVLRVAGTVDEPLTFDPEAAALSLATHFADAVLRAQGGAVSTEIGVDGALLFVVALPD